MASTKLLTLPKPVPLFLVPPHLTLATSEQKAQPHLHLSPMPSYPKDFSLSFLHTQYPALFPALASLSHANTVPLSSTVDSSLISPAPRLPSCKYHLNAVPMLVLCSEIPPGSHVNFQIVWSYLLTYPINANYFMSLSKCTDVLPSS